MHAEVKIRREKDENIIPFELDSSNQHPTASDIRMAHFHAKNFDFSNETRGQQPEKDYEEEKNNEKFAKNVHSRLNDALRDINEVCLDMSKLPVTHSYFVDTNDQAETDRLLALRESKKGELGCLSHDFSSELGDVYIKNSLFIKAKLYFLQFSDGSKKVKTKGTSKKIADKLFFSEFHDLLLNPVGEKSLKKYTENFSIKNSRVFLKHYRKKVTDTLIQKKFTFPGKLARYTMCFGNPSLYFLRIASSCLSDILMKICPDS